MNILDIIMRDHDNASIIFQKLLTTTTRAGRQREQQFAKLREELTQHMFAEEELFYPFLMDLTDDRDPVHEALEEHRLVRNVMADIEETAVFDESWYPKLRVLSEQINHHVRQEEGHFELASEYIDEDTAHDLGMKFQILKKETRTEKPEMAGARH